LVRGGPLRSFSTFKLPRKNKSKLGKIFRLSWFQSFKQLFRIFKAIDEFIKVSRVFLGVFV